MFRSELVFRVDGNIGPDSLNAYAYPSTSSNVGLESERTHERALFSRDSAAETGLPSAR